MSFATATIGGKLNTRFFLSCLAEWLSSTLEQPKKIGFINGYIGLVFSHRRQITTLKEPKQVQQKVSNE